MFRVCSEKTSQGDSRFITFKRALEEALQKMAHELSGLSNVFCIILRSLLQMYLAQIMKYWLWLECFEVIQFKRKQMPLTKVA